MAELKRYWLGKKGTLQVYQRTPLLAKQDEMEPITQEEAYARRAKLKEQQIQDRHLKMSGMEAPTEEDLKLTELKRLVAEGLVPAAELAAYQKSVETQETPGMEVPKKKTFDEMDVGELRTAAQEMKVPIDPLADAQVIRDELNAAVTASMPVIKTAETAAPEEAAPEFAAEDADDLTEMGQGALFAEAEKVDVKKAGKLDELRINIRRARKEKLAEKE